MSLREKIGQTALRGTSSRVKGTLPEELKQAVREGKVGAFLNVMNTDYVDELQRLATEESPHGIPLIFARDVIHGFRTIFPIPLGIAASWDPEVARACGRISAIEASSVGIRWTFAPMLDIARDSRWGRIAESPGEDPYLASLLAKGYVEGFHGNSLKDPTSMVTCAKHLIGYGAAIGGRDYNTAIIHEPLLRNLYVPPFTAAIKAGAPTVMSSFNEINGLPASGNKFLLTGLLRGELHFDGFVVSDWNSVTEMIDHGFARDEKHAAELAANAGLDMEMTSKAYEDHIESLIEEGSLSEDQIDFYVKNILKVKFRMGLFERPYRDKDTEKRFYLPDHLQKAKEAAIKSSVLLKNEQLLPLKKGTKIALIGPLANAPREQLGTWTFDGEADQSITPFKAFNEQSPEVLFSPGLTFSRDRSKEGFDEALRLAQKSDVILFVGGEEAILSGEAHSRADIGLPGAQESLIEKLALLGKPIILVIMAGRPIAISRIIDKVDAVLMCWHPGSMGGPALYDMIYGKSEPGGRLPVSWPKTAGQCPIFYNHKNTGRPADSTSFVHIDEIPVGAWQSSLGNNSHYLDAGFSPHFPFGYGLGYSDYAYSKLSLSHKELAMNEALTVTVSVTNTGTRNGEEVVQLYVQDVVGSITRPVRELKRFRKISLDQGETKKVSFRLSSKDLEFMNHQLEKRAEPGLFRVWVGPNSSSGLQNSFSLKEN
ncbi:glycosyl hydrolase [Fulvivirga sp. M361]|nr:glycosyl hydrolase [Fulvivirga sp. M361]